MKTTIHPRPPNNTNGVALIPLNRMIEKLNALDVEGEVRAHFWKDKAYNVSISLEFANEKLDKVKAICRLHAFDSIEFILSDKGASK